MRATLLLLLAMSSAAAADPGNELSIGPSTRFLRSTSANALTDDDLVGGTLGYARDLGRDAGISLHPDLTLWATAAYRWGSADGSLFQTIDTHVEIDELAIGARARFALHRRVILDGRVDLGTARTELGLTDAMGHQNGDSRWAGTGSTAIALDLMVVAHRRVGLGMRLEVGYVTATAPALEAKSRDGDDGTIMLPVDQVSIGHLDLGGRYVSFAWFGQF